MIHDFRMRLTRYLYNPSHKVWQRREGFLRFARKSSKQMTKRFPRDSKEEATHKSKCAQHLKSQGKVRS